MSTPTATFDGATIDADLDTARLSTQLAAVERLLASGAWYTLHELAFVTGYPQASVSARIRDLRKPRFGSRIIERRRAVGRPGTHEYRMDPERRADPRVPDATLQHVVVIEADGNSSSLLQHVVLRCTHPLCLWQHDLGQSVTVSAANDALARHPQQA